MPSGFYGDSYKEKKKSPKKVTIQKKVTKKKDDKKDIKIEEVKKVKKKTKSNTKRIINIIFGVVVILILLVVIDIVAVTKYNKGPFFAIKTKEYNDGGTKEYYGLFYKVIKYDQSVGRKDMELGSWNLKYFVEPIDYNTVDLALDLNNNPTANYEKISKKFLRISGTIKEANEINNEIILEYLDEDGDYTLDVVCKMWSDTIQLKEYKKGDKTVVLGSVNSFMMKTNNKPNTLTLHNCFVK